MRRVRAESQSSRHWHLKGLRSWSWVASPRSRPRHGLPPAAYLRWWEHLGGQEAADKELAVEAAPTWGMSEAGTEQPPNDALPGGSAHRRRWVRAAPGRLRPQHSQPARRGHHRACPVWGVGRGSRGHLRGRGGQARTRAVKQQQDRERGQESGVKAKPEAGAAQRGARGPFGRREGACAHPGPLFHRRD